MHSSVTALRMGRVALGLASILLFPGSVLLATTVSGVVTDAQSGAKLQGMVVAAYGTTSDPLATRTTDSDGKYSLQFSGEARLVAYDNAGVYATSFAGGAESFDLSPSVNSDQKNYNFAMTKGGRAAGSVATSDGQPISNLTVAAYNLSGTKRSSAVTDPNGNYSIVLPPGTFKFVVYDEVSPQRIVPRFYSERSSFELADGVPITSGGNVTVDFRLRLAAHLSGVVSDAQTHQPLPLQVSAYTMDGAPAGMTTADFLGRYTMTVPEGTLRILTFDPSGAYATAFYSGANSFERATPIVVASGGTRTGLDVTAERGGNVSGAISANGVRLCCMTVAAYNVDGTRRGFTRTDNAGNYTLVLPPGEFRIGAYDEGLVYATEFYDNAPSFLLAAPVTVVRFQTTSGIDLSLGRAARVTGRISDRVTGTAIPSIIVSAYDANGTFEVSASSNAAGSYVLALPPGRHRLVAFDLLLRYVTVYPQLAPTFEESPWFDLAADTTRTVDFTLFRGITVTGTVVDLSLTPLSGMEIGALSLIGNRVSSTTARDGAFSMVLPAGNYKFVSIDSRARFFTMYFTSSFTLAGASPVSVSPDGSTSQSIGFVLVPQTRRRASVH